MRKEEWTAPTLQKFGSVDELTASGKTFGFQDAWFSISIGPVSITVPGRQTGGGSTGS